MADRRDITVARRMTPAVRQFAASGEAAEMGNDTVSPTTESTQLSSQRENSKSSRKHSLNSIRNPDGAPTFEDTTVEWKQYSGRLPAHLLRAFKRLCLEREMLGQRPYRQQELLSEAVEYVLRNYGMHE